MDGRVTTLETKVETLDSEFAQMKLDTQDELAKKADMSYVKSIKGFQDQNILELQNKYILHKDFVSTKIDCLQRKLENYITN